MIIVGVYCFFTPVETSAVIPFVLGIVMIGDGIGRIVTCVLFLHTCRNIRCNPVCAGNRNGR